MRLIDLELDLDVFAGPFDLLLTLILREEIDLLEVDLADIVVSYIDHLERRGELDLEMATEFLVLIAALLELKSRLMLPGEEPELVELEPQEAVEELLERLLDAHRYRAASELLRERLAGEAGHWYRSAPLPARLRRASLAGAQSVYEPALLGRALGRLLEMPKAIDLRHLPAARISVGERLSLLRTLLRRRGSFGFEEAVAGADRITVAVTVFALLELHKRGEASWEQEGCFGEITVTPAASGGPGVEVAA